MKIYIAGPISGIALYNRPAFEKARAILSRDGAICIIPHDIYTPSNNPCPAVIWCEAMLKCLPVIESCNAVYFLDGWERSAGSRREMKMAINKKIPICSILYIDSSNSGYIIQDMQGITA